MTQEERNAIKKWEAFHKNMNNATISDDTLTVAEREKHRLYLEAHPLEWIKFFFPKYAKAEFASFHIKAINRLLNNMEWYEVLSWSRELAKSTIIMFVILFLALTGKKKNILMCSATIDSAKRLLAPYREELENNERIVAYYGEQRNFGNWAEDEFVTKKGVAFRALGAGNAPRGTRNSEVRPDAVLFDDFDTDEECLNIEVLDKKWNWAEKAVIPTRSINNPLTVIWCGNIIAEDCCVARAAKMADHHEIINIRMVDINHPNPSADYQYGTSVWNKNSEENIDRALSKISKKAGMGEYFNCPLAEGRVFEKIKYGKVPPLKKFKFVVVYGDPTQSESKSKTANKKGSYKAVWLCGELNDNLYIIKGFLFRGLSEEFVNCYFILNRFVGGVTPVYNFIENNSLQNPFFKQIFVPLAAKLRKETGMNITITPDTEPKADKGIRIEADLEPISREGRLIFNIDQQNDPHMQELVNEAKFFAVHLPYHADGLDCIQGAKQSAQKKRISSYGVSSVSREEMNKYNKNR